MKRTVRKLRSACPETSVEDFNLFDEIRGSMTLLKTTHRENDYEIIVFFPRNRKYQRSTRKPARRNPTQNKQTGPRRRQESQSTLPSLSVINVLLTTNQGLKRTEPKYRTALEKLPYRIHTF